MNKILSANKIRLGEVASAIGTTPKAIRNWLARYPADIDAGKREDIGSREFVMDWLKANPQKSLLDAMSAYTDSLKGSPDSRQEGWTEFSILDVAHLAITRVLVGYGLPAHRAYTFTKELLRGVWAPLLQYSTTPPTALLASLLTLKVSMGLRDGEVVDLIVSHSPPDEGFSIADVAPHALVLLPHKIISAAFEALENMGYLNTDGQTNID